MADSSGRKHELSLTQACPLSPKKWMKSFLLLILLSKSSLVTFISMIIIYTKISLASLFISIYRLLVELVKNRYDWHANLNIFLEIKDLVLNNHNLNSLTTSSTQQLVTDDDPRLGNTIGFLQIINETYGRKNHARFTAVATRLRYSREIRDVYTIQEATQSFSSW